MTVSSETETAPENLSETVWDDFIANLIDKFCFVLFCFKACKIFIHISLLAACYLTWVLEISLFILFLFLRELSVYFVAQLRVLMSVSEQFKGD